MAMSPPDTWAAGSRPATGEVLREITAIGPAGLKPSDEREPALTAGVDSGASLLPIFIPL
jgi:hypothetical protein